MKERSYEQKNLYLQTQEIEMGLMDELARVEEEEKLYYEFKQREEKHRQLIKIINKLRSSFQQGRQDAGGELKLKIAAMAQLRSDLTHQDEHLNALESGIEEQEYIIEGLKVKAENYEEEEDDQLRKKYEQKYEELYFGKESNLDNWRNYQSYLQELLKRNKLAEHLVPGRPASYMQAHHPHRDPKRAVISGRTPIGYRHLRT